MKNSKKIFLVVAVLFLLAMAYISYDISSRTTFPGSKPQLKERLLKASEISDDSLSFDSVSQDTTHR